VLQRCAVGCARFSTSITMNGTFQIDFEKSCGVENVVGVTGLESLVSLRYHAPVFLRDVGEAVEKFSSNAQGSCGCGTGRNGRRLRRPAGAASQKNMCTIGAIAWPRAHGDSAHLV